MNAISAKVPVCAEIHARITLPLLKLGLLNGSRNQLLGKAIRVDFCLDLRGFGCKGFDRSSDWAGSNGEGSESRKDNGELHFFSW